MQKKDDRSLTQRIGGNRTIVLGIMIVMLCLFTVDYYIPQALGLGKQESEYVKFVLGGRTVTLAQGRYQTQLGSWQQFQTGQARLTGQQRGGASEYLEDLMLAEMARDAGIVITDDTLRGFIQANPLFTDSRGEFDPKGFDRARASVFGGMTTRAYEEQARVYLLVDHYRKLYGNSFLTVSDEEAYRKWKADAPRIGISYTGLPVAPVRERLSPADVKPEDVEAYWSNSIVQNRHKQARRFAFDAAWVRVADVEDRAWLEAREQGKDDADLKLGDGEALAFWSERRQYELNLAGLPGETLEALRKENEARVAQEDEEVRKKVEEALKKAEEARKKAVEEGKDPPPLPPGAVPPPAPPGDAPPLPPPPAIDLSKIPPADLDEPEKYRRYWRHRVEKEVWLRHLLRKVLKEASEGKKPLAEVAEKWSRPGLRIHLLAQTDPVDQYGVEKIPGLGGPNCPLRYSINGYTKEKEGTYHLEVVGTTARADALGDRGWVAFQVQKVLKEAVPPLEEVRDRVLPELLDERARDLARAELEAFRKAAEDGRKTLEDAAGEKGMECASAGPFNAYSWKPPAPKPVPGAGAPSPAERGRDPDRRLCAVMDRYGSIRETPVGAFSPVLDDVEGTGFFYLAQVKSRSDPRFEEMTEAQITRARRSIVGERLQALAREISYERLKERLQLTVGGQPAPEAEESRGRRR